MVIAPEMIQNHTETLLYVPVTNLEPKYDFALEQCEKFNNFMAYL